MQSALVDIGLDGDAFLYVSDVFENLEDYDHGHPHEQPQTSMGSLPPAIGSPVEVLPGESLARASEHHEVVHPEEFHQDEAHSVHEQHAFHDEVPAAEGQHFQQHHDAVQSAPIEDQHAEAAEERQPDSNASAPQNFAPHYNPTQNYPARGGNDRPSQNLGRGDDSGGEPGPWGGAVGAPPRAAPPRAPRPRATAPPPTTHRPREQAPPRT